MIAVKPRILNIGCGSETYGTDFVDKYPPRAGVKKCDVDVQRLPYPDNTFEKVYCNSLFEHLTNPRFFLKEAKRVLKKDGTIEIITDNANYWVWALSNKAHSGSYVRHGSEDTHYALFTEKHLRNWCELAGLKVLKVEYLTQNTVKRPGHAVRLIFDKIVQHTPLRNAGYYQLRVVCKKQ
jgi:ubiquinone/menaquinone biosynthesis C-methylase UbiE